MTSTAVFGSGFEPSSFARDVKWSEGEGGRDFTTKNQDILFLSEMWGKYTFHNAIGFLLGVFFYNTIGRNGESNPGLKQISYETGGVAHTSKLLH